MFEASLITLLVSDSLLVSKLTTYRGAPAVFADTAPKAASCEVDLPYIVFDIDRSESNSMVVEIFDINMGIYGKITRAKVIREIAERIYFILDLSVITTDSRFSDIRFFRESSDFIYRASSKVTQREVRFTARGIRKKWIDQL